MPKRPSSCRERPDSGVMGRIRCSCHPSSGSGWGWGWAWAAWGWHARHEHGNRAANGHLRQSAGWRSRCASRPARPRVDGPIGRVQGLVVDPTDHHVTHVLLAKGHLWGEKEVAIPIGAARVFTRTGFTDSPAVRRLRSARLSDLGGHLRSGSATQLKEPLDTRWSARVGARSGPARNKNRLLGCGWRTPVVLFCWPLCSVLTALGGHGAKRSTPAAVAGSR